MATAVALRIGEGLGLRWSDVDFDAGTLSVRQAMERSGGDSAARRPLLAAKRAISKQIKAAPKRSAERRELRVQEEAIRVEWQGADGPADDGTEARPQPSDDPHAEDRGGRVEATPDAPTHGRLVAWADWQDPGLVFTSPIGTALHARNVLREFHDVLNVAGCPPSGCTISGIPPPRCCSRKGSTRARSWRRSGTRRSA